MRIGLTLVLIQSMDDFQITNVGRVASTQDAALSLNILPGHACVSFEQFDGRGRRGNEWNGEGGVAVTVVLQESSPILPVAVAATLTSSVNNVLPQVSVGIKWPNDLYIDGKKICGILIEQKEGVCLVGVGLNVACVPIETATSMREFGYEGTLDMVASMVVASVLTAVQLTEMQAVTSWRERDILVGTMQTVLSGSNTVSGLVLDIDPHQNLILQTELGILTLPAATASVVNH